MSSIELAWVSDDIAILDIGPANFELWNPVFTDLFILICRHPHKDAHIGICNLFEVQGQWKVKSFVPGLLRDELLVVDQ